MSLRRKSRIKRGQAPRKANNSLRVLTENTYRKHSRSAIKRDFGERCAFSMIHDSNAGGSMGIHIDHFDPTLSGRRRHAYKNLFPSAGSCNITKLDNWPTEAQRKEGFRFLNPCEEHDYGKHIFEELESGYLVATTKAGFYHIVYMGLNDSHFVDNRLERTEFHKRLDADFLILKKSNADPGDVAAAKRIFDTLKAAVERAIPRIPAPPKGVTLFRTHLGRKRGQPNVS